MESTILSFKRNEPNSFFRVHIKVSPVLTSLWLYTLFLIIVSSKQRKSFIRMSQIFLRAPKPSSRLYYKASARFLAFDLLYCFHMAIPTSNTQVALLSNTGPAQGICCYLAFSPLLFCFFGFPCWGMRDLRTEDFLSRALSPKLYLRAQVF